MKKTLILLACLMGALTVSAQKESAVVKTDKMLFNHWSIGLDVGTPGIGADIATTCTDYLQIRAGFAIFPKVTYDKVLKLKDSNGNLPPAILNLPSEVNTQGKANLSHGDVLLSVYPFRSTRVPVAITLGAYFGTSDIINLKNTDAFTPEQMEVIENGNWGLGLDNYRLPFKDGQSTPTMRVNKFRPYAGLSFGRAVPKHKRVGFMMDLGVMMWNTPEVKDSNDKSLTKNDVGEEAGKVIDIVRKFSVYPVLNFRINGRIF